MKTWFYTVFAAVAFAALTAPHAATAAGGLAYDAVTRMAMPGSTAAPAPGTFEADFTAAGQPASDPHLPFGLGRGMGAAMSMFGKGTAEKHYLSAHKQRVDNLSTQTADITDCAARTLTHLNLAAKTYTVTSLDQPSSPSGAPHGASPASSPSAGYDDGSTYSFDVTTKALGPLAIDGVNTQGYDSNVTMTTTTKNGDSSSTKMEILAYYAPMTEPRVDCYAPPTRERGRASSAGAAMVSYDVLLRALKARGDQRYKVTSSGPALPADEFVMWSQTKIAGGDRANGGTFAVINERGHVHQPLSDDDPVFSVPSSFTKSG